MRLLCSVRGCYQHNELVTVNSQCERLVASESDTMVFDFGVTLRLSPAIAALYVGRQSDELRIHYYFVPPSTKFSMIVPVLSGYRFLGGLAILLQNELGARMHESTAVASAARGSKHKCV
eukprot:SAG11_NODE_491_length_8977_cov_7.387249_7_plen_120_part_00